MSGAGARAAPVRAGDTFERDLTLSADSIRAFAGSVDDWNPLHHDAARAVAAGFPGLIASGTQVASVLMAMTATHYSEPLADGTPCQSLGLGFRLRFSRAVVADEPMHLAWTVREAERKESLRGWIVRLDGLARSARGRLLEATGEILLRTGSERLAPAAAA